MGETKNRSRAERLTRIVVGAGFAIVLTSMALSSGWISLPFPQLPSFGEIDVAVTLPDGARIVNIEPISLDCRARVHAEVPVEGRREHKLGEFVYRTDTITMTAIGDVDTCVDGGAADVTFHRDGSTEVTIPGPSIRFVRPRVDAQRPLRPSMSTAGSSAG